jgi:hypothetical protein
MNGSETSGAVTDPDRPAEAQDRGSRKRLAKRLDIERTWSPDREAMLAALRVALGLPRVLPYPRERGER